MKLAQDSKVLLTMGTVSNDGSLANARQALELSYPIIENVLETTFTQQTRTDFFDVIEGVLFLRLTNMFVDADSFVLRRSLNGDSLVAPTDGEVVDKGEYILDAVRGLVSFRVRQAPGKCCLSCSYDSGLSLLDGFEDVLAAPQWLESCGVAVAVHVMNTFPSSPANRKATSVAAVSAEIRQLTSVLLSSRARPRLTVEFPVASLLDE